MKINKNKKKTINKYNVKIIVDIPLLFESKIENMFDKIIVVKCNRKAQIERILKNKKYTKKEINQIINSQMPLKEKIKKADFVINNNKSFANSKKQIISFINSN